MALKFLSQTDKVSPLRKFDIHWLVHCFSEKDTMDIWCNGEKMESAVSKNVLFCMHVFQNGNFFAISGSVIVKCVRKFKK